MCAYILHVQRVCIAYSVSDIACWWGQEAMIIIACGVTNRRAEYKVLKYCISVISRPLLRIHTLNNANHG